jgi:hypothetical protein
VRMYPVLRLLDHPKQFELTGYLPHWRASWVRELANSLRPGTAVLSQDLVESDSLLAGERQHG